jgi:tripartite-type tricarboxylate transporter receptor subunit TctC
MRKRQAMMNVMAVGILTAGIAAVSTQAAAAGAAAMYPNKSIRIVTTEIGAGNDLLARIVAQGIAGPLGQPVIVENRATTVSGVITAQAVPDGYTLLLAANASWLGQFLQDMPYDAVRDFAPVSTVSNQPVVLVVHPSLPAKSVKELIALARARPGELFYGSSTTATVSHLAGELLKSMAGINIVRVPFKGAGPALVALIGSEVQMTFPTPSVVPQHVKAGRIRALAVSGLQPSPLLPELPTMSASGMPGYEVVSRAGIFAPVKTPAPIINRLNQEIVRALVTAEVKDKILALGSEPAGSTPDEFKTMIKADMSRMGKVIKDAGMREGK